MAPDTILPNNYLARKSFVFGNYVPFQAGGVMPFRNWKEVEVSVLLILFMEKMVYNK